MSKTTQLLLGEVLVVLLTPQLGLLNPKHGCGCEAIDDKPKIAIPTKKSSTIEKKAQVTPDHFTSTSPRNG